MISSCSAVKGRPKYHTLPKRLLIYKQRAASSHPFYQTNKSHVITSGDGKAAVWAGTIDDIWQMGKPVGEGGPWKYSAVKAGVASDPYLIGFYDKRSLKLSHDSKEAVTFTIEVAPIGHGPWMNYQTFTVKPGDSLDYFFPENFQSRWIRFVANKDCGATAFLKYE